MSNLTNIYSKVYGYAAQSDTHHILQVSTVFYSSYCRLVAGQDSIPNLDVIQKKHLSQIVRY